MTLKVLDNEHNKIDTIHFSSDVDISFLKAYKHFAYNIDFYKGTERISVQKIGVSVIHIDNNAILITFNGFVEQASKAVITSLSAYTDSDELLIQFEHEITYTFSN